MSIAKPSCVMPNSLLRRKYDATFAHAAMVEPVPPPRITRSNSSGCDFLSTRGDEVLSVRFTRLSLSERQIHSGLSLISPGQPLTLPRETVHSRLLGQYALSTVE